MNWHEAVDLVSPHIVKIETEQGHGTGFFCFTNPTAELIGLATAQHVIARAHRWRQPLIIHNHGQSAFLTYPQRVIYEDDRTDSAMIVIPRQALQSVPDSPINLAPQDKRLRTGSEVGWLGYPSVDPNTLCLFSGRISAWKSSVLSYFIDGVSINGISGGPVFHFIEGPGSGKLVVVGALTEYWVNRSTGEALPGLALARSLEHFHGVIGALNSLEAAKRAQEEEGPSPPEGFSEQSADNDPNAENHERTVS